MHGPKHLEKVLERRAEVEAEVGLRLPMAKRRTCFLYLRVEALESPWGGSVPLLLFASPASLLLSPLINSHHLG